MPGSMAATRAWAPLRPGAEEISLAREDPGPLMRAITKVTKEIANRYASGSKRPECPARAVLTGDPEGPPLAHGRVS
jgi:hypothetical protein